ncbi:MULTISPECIES: hypothetical protein [Pseudofrankia]|uniref:hypothetical protein n=1 Tax=Pseudofrankia TaxID=2994363 RepID=UPI000234D046|nr:MULTISPECIES: hypothetical protein [Pseudofrankia]OHV33011.1 hypothetical protein BCD49_28245 [Pseudofrankia sp. EUN1h]
MTLCCGLLRLDGADVRRSTLTSMLASSSLGLPAARGVHLDGPFGVIAAAGVADDPTPPIAVDDHGLTVVVVTAARPVHVRLAAHAGRYASSDAGWGGIGPDGGRLGGGDGGGPDRGGLDRGGLDAGEPDVGEPDADGRAGGAVACRVAAAYRSVGERCLRGLAPDKLVIVWDSAVRRLLVARTGRLAADLLTWSDGRHIAFGTEPGQLLAAFRAPLLGLLPGQVPGPSDAVARLRPRRVGGAEPDAAGPELAAPTQPRRLGRVRQLAPGDLVSISVAVARRGPGGAGLRLVPRPAEPESAPGTVQGE